MTINLVQSLLARGVTLACCDCQTTALVTHRGQLPTGWHILVGANDKGGQLIQVHCPAHDPVFEIPTEELINE